MTHANIANYSLYEVLGLGEWGSSADVEAIKKAYHKAVLMYHPDKKGNSGETEEDRSMFLKIQEAFTVLCNEQKRRAYDSQLDFDESIPTDLEAAEASKAGIAAFCELFGPVFQRNARFATHRPVPDLGDAATPIHDVYRFYDYWIKFESWRDFSMVKPEHDVESATCREEKRWMIKENERVSKKLKKKEISRITELVMRAMDKDPRVLLDKERKIREKQLLKQQREEKERLRLLKAREERELKEKDEAERLKSEKEEREKAKKQQSRNRNAFRRLVRQLATLENPGSARPTLPSEYGIFSTDDIDFICSRLQSSKLAEVNVSLGGEEALKDVGLLPANAKDIINKILAEMRAADDASLEEEKRQDEERKREQAEKAAAADRKKRGLDRAWTKEELSMLSKTIGKFPAGTRNRWDVICNAMNDQLRPSTPFDKEGVMFAAHNAMQLLAQLKETKSGIPSRLATPVTTALSPTPPPEVAVVAPALPAVSPVEAAVLAAKKSVPVPVVSPPTKVSPSPPAPAVIEEVVNEWSQEQQLALEKGLKKYPASMDKAERWTKIAEEVPGKTKKDCMARFKHLREEILAKKKSAK